MIRNSSSHGMVVKHSVKRNIFGMVKERATVVYHPNNSTLTVIKGDTVDEIDLLGPGIEGHLMIYEDLINWQQNTASESPLHVIDSCCHVIVGTTSEKFKVSIFTDHHIPETSFQISSDESRIIRDAQRACAPFFQDGVFFGSKSMTKRHLLALKPFIWHEY